MHRASGGDSVGWANSAKDTIAMRNEVSRRNIWRVVRICIIFAIIHSLLASKQAKELVCEVTGPRYRNGVYRFAYVIQSVVFSAWAAWWFVHLPDRELYRVPPPWSWLMRAGQLASVGLLFSTLRVLGFFDASGIRELQQFRAGLNPDPEPAAQGPPLGANGEMVVAGPFRLIRHPGNLSALGMFLLFPRMTVNRAMLAALVTLYVILGSLHEEYRLRAAYGAAYERYRYKVPFLLPRLPWRNSVRSMFYKRG